MLYRNICKVLLAAAIMPAATAIAAKDNGGSIATSNLRISRSGDMFNLTTDLVLDSLRLGANNQIFVTPIVTGPDSARVTLPSVMINGRNMQIALERGTLRKDALARFGNLYSVVRRNNGTPQSVAYTAQTPMEKWMLSPETQVKFVYDTCGCGDLKGRSIGSGVPVDLNPAPKMRTVYITPPVTELPVTIHEGKARVQFEVNKTDLHAEPYRCRNGQMIDNRGQLAMIVDSVRYAVSDPNVEIARIEICGYASPESPYLHNDFLATNRSRALSEYIGNMFHLPAEKSAYSAVPENWGEFREQVLNAKDITEEQRADLLQLIDAPAYGPSDYDAKEKILKTDKRFAKLYASKILPEWFPHLRATKFAISTQLKPVSDERLAEIILTNPGLLSLNQMFRVARLYPEGSPEFNRTIDTALSLYADDPIANLNAAVTAINNGNLDRAETLLKKAGDSPEAENARGVLAAHRGDYKEAAAHFDRAGSLPEALRNKALIAD